MTSGRDIRKISDGFIDSLSVDLYIYPSIKQKKCLQYVDFIYCVDKIFKHLLDTGIDKNDRSDSSDKSRGVLNILMV